MKMNIEASSNKYKKSRSEQACSFCCQQLNDAPLLFDGIPGLVNFLELFTGSLLDISA
jgi:hypothetical protein